MTKELAEMKDKEGKLPEFAWPGGYPIVYYDAHCAVLCADCASKEDWNEADIIGFAIYWEGPMEYCENCNTEIESAYGNPESN